MTTDDQEGQETWPGGDGGDGQGAKREDNPDPADLPGEGAGHGAGEETGAEGGLEGGPEPKEGEDGREHERP
jgi:hypothetical protein